MCMCMCACACGYVHVGVCMWVCACVCEYVHVGVCMCMWVCACVCGYVHVGVQMQSGTCICALLHICVWPWLCLWVWVWLWVCMRECEHTRALVHVHTHAQVHERKLPLPMPLRMLLDRRFTYAMDWERSSPEGLMKPTDGSRLPPPYGMLLLERRCSAPAAARHSSVESGADPAGADPAGADPAATDPSNPADPSAAARGTASTCVVAVRHVSESQLAAGGGGGWGGGGMFSELLLSLDPGHHVTADFQGLAVSPSDTGAKVGYVRWGLHGASWGLLMRGGICVV